MHMENQPYINKHMCSVIMDCLGEIHMKFKFVSDTLHLMVDILDYYLTKKEVTPQRLQLVEVTAMLIASKYEELHPPALRDLLYICINAYSKDEVSLLSAFIKVCLVWNSL